MKIICAFEDYDFSSKSKSLGVVLYGQAQKPELGSAGAALKDVMRRRKYHAAPRAWDFVSIALSVVTADLAGHRDRSPNGWTREFDLEVAVADPTFWTSQTNRLESLLGFLTTDRWQLHFIEGGFQPTPERDVVLPKEDCIVLLSGGLDSFIGAIDLVASGNRPFAVSQSVRGDDEKQDEFAALIGEGLSHMRLNHNAHTPNPEAMPSQRARSMVFMAYGVLSATSLAQYHVGEHVVLNMCENGFISINPPLTDMRLGSLSTRTSHPVVLSMLQQVLDAAGLRIRLTNPYQHKTKGEMLVGCQDQSFLLTHAHQTTSCGRFKRYGYKHCGRCVPCLIRRSAFARWGVDDRTKYRYKNLSKNDAQHARSDDVRAAAMAVAEVKEDGLEAWLGASLSSTLIQDKDALRQVASRGLDELAQFLQLQKVR
jgi:7-cyano-7-deazaguanine synthase in queuosine biosynthesis